MAKYNLGPMPARISAEVVALLEQTETATVGHWRHWGFVDRAVPATRRPRSSACTPRSTKPQWRQWPTVAVSVCSSRATTSALICAGMGPS